MRSREKYKDTVRDQETLEAKNAAWARMEAVEHDYYTLGEATWEEVEEVRDAYFDTWEDRRNFILGEKYGIEAPSGG